MIRILFLFAAALAQTGALKIEIKGVREKSGGSLVCALFRSDRGFPMQAEEAFEIQEASRSGTGWECSFWNLRPARYAVSVVHDENGDGKMNTGRFGIPKEGWATSNNVYPKLRPPNFNESSVRIDAGAKSLSVNMRY